MKSIGTTDHRFNIVLHQELVYINGLHQRFAILLPVNKVSLLGLLSSLLELMYAVISITNDIRTMLNQLICLIPCQQIRTLSPIANVIYNHKFDVIEHVLQLVDRSDRHAYWLYPYFESYGL